jgi:hypothetical protein|tara:strand:+ start:295 stop:1065 length:771 start_codon:yes stop_codon:yes gene_type:complete
MAIQTIGIGTVADDGTGDSLRVAGDKINDNFNEIYTTLGDGSSLTSTAITALNNATANELVTVGATTTELDAEANLTFDGTTLAVTGNITVPNDGDIGSVGATDAIQISSAGIVTFKDDILIKDGGTIGVASSTSAITIASTGIVTFVDDIIIKDAGTIGSVSDVDAISISSTGIVTFSQIPSVPINTIEISTQTRGAFLVIESGGTDGAGANAGDNIIDETDSDDIIHESATDLVGSVFNIIDSAGMVVRTINSV